jgi:hypothetical protein
MQYSEAHTPVHAKPGMGRPIPMAKKMSMVPRSDVAAERTPAQNSLLKRILRMIGAVYHVPAGPNLISVNDLCPSLGRLCQTGKNAKALSMKKGWNFNEYSS